MTRDCLICLRDRGACRGVNNEQECTIRQSPIISHNRIGSMFSKLHGTGEGFDPRTGH